MRKIIHIDMDAFFAAVEQRDNPALRGKPVIVGGLPQSRGVVATCSYEARRFGVHSAMPSAHALRLCPNAIFLKPRFSLYRAISQEIRALMQEVTPLVEPLSLDEAYLDVSDCTQHQGSATRIAEALRQKIARKTGLTASAGVSFNKMLAKIASDLNKPDGLAVITPELAPAFIDQLPIEKFHGIGKATAERFHQLGIRTGAQLKSADEVLLSQSFGKRGLFYYHMAHGDDPRAVEPIRERKSIGSETTFAEDLHQKTDILAALLIQHQSAFAQVQSKALLARTLTIKLKYNDFTQLTRSHTATTAYPTPELAAQKIRDLYAQISEHKPVRLVGVTYSGLSLAMDERQYRLFP